VILGLIIRDFASVFSVLLKSVDLVSIIISCIFIVIFIFVRNRICDYFHCRSPLNLFFIIVHRYVTSLNKLLCFKKLLDSSGRKEECCSTGVRQNFGFIHKFLEVLCGLKTAALHG
jgi:hypothetical protein